MENSEKDTKQKRYCKGCLCDVTETMYCYCSERSLLKEDTYTEEEIKQIGGVVMTKEMQEQIEKAQKNKEKFDRYQLLCKEANYIIKFMSNWEIFDFDNLQKVLDEMKGLQKQIFDISNDKSIGVKLSDKTSKSKLDYLKEDNYTIPSIETISEISEVCKKYQEERVSGRWYITQTGLNKVAKILGGQYLSLTKKQKRELHRDCISQAQDSIPHVKIWRYYLSI